MGGNTRRATRRGPGACTRGCGDFISMAAESGGAKRLARIRTRPGRALQDDGRVDGIGRLHDGLHLLHVVDVEGRRSSRSRVRRRGQQLTKEIRAMVVLWKNKGKKGPHRSGDWKSDVMLQKFDGHGVSIHTGIAFSQRPREPSPGTCWSKSTRCRTSSPPDEGLVQRNARIGIEHAGAGLATGSRWPPLCRWCSPARPNAPSLWAFISAQISA